MNQTIKNNHKPAVVIIIPSYNGLEDLRHCLNSIARSSYPNQKTIVVDNNSEPTVTAAVAAEFPWVELIALSKNTGFAGACAEAWTRVNKLGGPYALLLNQDALIEPNTLELLVGFLEKNVEVAAVQPIILRAPENQLINSLGNCINYLGFGYSFGDGLNLHDKSVAHLLSKPSEIAYGSGAALLIRVSALKGQELFDRDFFMYHEDLDLGWRLRLLGLKSFLVPEARARHRYDFHRSSRIKYEYGERNRFMVLLQNYHWATLLAIFPAWLVMEIGVVAFSILHGWFGAKIKGYYYVWRYLPKILSRRRSIQKTRRLKERAVVNIWRGDILYQEGPSLMLSLLNPFFSLYWSLIKRIIYW